MRGPVAGPGRDPRDAGCCTCFRGSCRDNSGCWVAARVSAPPRSLPPRCSLAPFHPHPEIPARRGASRRRLQRRPPSGPVFPPNRSPAAVQSFQAGLVRLQGFVHLRSAGFPESQAGKLAAPGGGALLPAGASRRAELPPATLSPFLF